MTITGTFINRYEWQPDLDTTQEFWLILGSCGEYADYVQWIVSVHTTEQEADAVLAAYEALQPATPRPSIGNMVSTYRVDGPFTANGSFEMRDEDDDGFDDPEFDDEEFDGDAVDDETYEEEIPVEDRS